MKVAFTTLILMGAMACSVPNGFGGTLDLVLIPAAKQRNREYYSRVADLVCGTRTSCMVNFWADRTHIPQPKIRMDTGEDLAVMTGSYERSPNYTEPHLHLACWLYPSKSVGEAAACEYEPGAKKPLDR